MNKHCEEESVHLGEREDEVRGREERRGERREGKGNRGGGRH